MPIPASNDLDDLDDFQEKIHTVRTKLGLTIPPPRTLKEYTHFHQRYIEPTETLMYNRIRDYCKRKRIPIPPHDIDFDKITVELESEDLEIKEEIEALAEREDIPTIEEDEIQTYKTGVQTVFFTFNGDPSCLTDFPLALEGDFIFSQTYEATDGSWEEEEYFSKHPSRNIIFCRILPFGLTGNFRIIYGKYISPPTQPSLISKDLEKSSDIDSTTKTKELHETNISASSSKIGKKYLVHKAAIARNTRDSRTE